MTFRAFIFLLFALLTAGGVLPPVHADAPRYKFQVGQTLRYEVTFDSRLPNLAETSAPTGDDGAAPGVQVAERVTARVKDVRADGTASLDVTVEPWRNSSLAGPQTYTLRLTPTGVRLPVTGSAAPSLSAALPFPALLPAHPHPNPTLAEMGQSTSTVTHQQQQTHDGLLVDTTERRRQERIVFDAASGNVLKQASTTWVTRSLRMTNRGKRGSDDFGRVAGVTRLILRTTVQRLEDKPPPANAELPAAAP